MPDEIKKPKFTLTHLQTTIAILVGIVTLIGGLYSIKKNVFSEKLNGDLKGFIKDKISQKYISGVTIEIYDSSNALIESLLSDSSGIFQKKNLKEGAYTVKIISPKYEPDLKTVSIIGKETTDVAFNLAPIEKGKSAVAKAIEEKAAELIKNFGKEPPKPAESNNPQN